MRIVAAFLLLLTLSACTTTKIIQPPAGASPESGSTYSADDALTLAKAWPLSCPTSQSCYIDTPTFKGTDPTYVSSLDPEVKAAALLQCWKMKGLQDGTVSWSPPILEAIGRWTIVAVWQCGGSPFLGASGGPIYSAWVFIDAGPRLLPVNSNASLYWPLR